MAYICFKIFYLVNFFAWIDTLELKYIIEICVALDITLIGIAFPILIDKVSIIGDKYQSNFLEEIFQLQYPNNSIFNKSLPIKQSPLFFSVYVALFSFIPLILNRPPPFELDNWLINNSAKLFTILSTLYLTINFIIWIKRIAIYHGNPNKLCQTLIHLNDVGEVKEKQLKLKCINEITLYAVRKNNTRLCETLHTFYSQLFIDLRNKHANSNKPITYPITLYEIVGDINEELSRRQKSNLTDLEISAISGKWLLGGSKYIPISSKSFSEAWANLCAIHKESIYINKFWSHSHHHYTSAFRWFNLQNNYISNPEIFEKDKDKFLELHYALGGLLLYSKRYDTISYVLDYSTSDPPDYVLLPKSMTDIFMFFERVRNDYTPRNLPLDLEYRFPGLDNLGNSYQIKYWICSFIIVLFIRQFSLKQTGSYSYKKDTSLPKLPQGVENLRDWKDGLPFFKHCLKDIFSNDILLTQLNLSKVVENKYGEIESFINSLETNIKQEITTSKKETKIKNRKKCEFFMSTRKIIKPAIKQLTFITKTYSPQFLQPTDLLIPLGVYRCKLYPKSMFSSNDIYHSVEENLFAQEIREKIIKTNSFDVYSKATTQRLLISKKDLTPSIERLISNNRNVIIISSIRDEFLNKVKDRNKSLKLIKIDNHFFKNKIFILKESDIPSIEFLDKATISDLPLKKIDQEIKLYASVIDLNDPEYKNYKDKWPVFENDDPIETKAEVTINFNAIIRWKSKREVVQINVQTPYEEQGTLTELKDIKPFSTPSPSDK